MNVRSRRRSNNCFTHTLPAAACPVLAMLLSDVIDEPRFELIAGGMGRSFDHVLQDPRRHQPEMIIAIGVEQRQNPLRFFQPRYQFTAQRCDNAQTVLLISRASNELLEKVSTSSSLKPVVKSSSN